MLTSYRLLLVGISKKSRAPWPDYVVNVDVPLLIVAWLITISNILYNLLKGTSQPV